MVHTEKNFAGMRIVQEIPDTEASIAYLSKTAMHFRSLDL